MSGLIDEIAKEGRVPLELYGHQVGGHHMLFKYKDKVCKPVIPREHFFYQTAPDVVTRYIPAYHGVVDVCYLHQSSGEIEVVAFSKPQPTPVPPSLQEKKGIMVQGKEFPRLSIPKCSSGNTIHTNGTSLKSYVTNGEGYTNPWAIKCRQNMDEKLKELEGHLGSFTNDYIILENLTSKYQCPCVLDLKVGTRQHGDDAPPYKVKKHIKTCSMSTSSSLGVRMAGMQKYNALKNEYVFFDKYFGKQLTEEELQQVLLSFFDNGICLRSDIFPTLVRMLSDLKASIKALPTFRYFSSSLLIIYDGAGWPQDLPPAAGLVRRDFDSILLRTQRAESPEIDSSAQNAQEQLSTELEGTRTNSESSSLPEPGVSLTPPTSGGEGLMSAEELSRARRVVDVRMIDFAHSTHSCYHDKISYNGLDEGYLRGMSTLIRMFEGMQRNYCQNGCGL